MSLDDYRAGFDSATVELLPAFIRYEAMTDRVEALAPPVTNAIVGDPRVFGDDWAEPLAPEDGPVLDHYIRRIEHLATYLDFVAFRVGDREHVVELRARRFGRGVTFATPRRSL